MEPRSDAVWAAGFGMAEMVPALDAGGRNFVGVLRSLEPTDGDRPVPPTKWTVAETAVHVLTIIRRGLGDRRRADSLEGLAQLNDQCIDEIPERQVEAIADLIETDMKRYIDLLAALTDDVADLRVVPLHAEVQADLPTALSYQLFDFLAHGFDIARATGRPWKIDPHHAALVLRASLPAIRPWVTNDAISGPRQRTVISFPDADFALALQTGDGAYQVQPATTDEADVEIDPVDLFLALAGRQKASDPTVGRLASWYAPI
jgi:uncharacterized protein (TIGR03083 family)